MRFISALFHRARGSAGALRIAAIPMLLAFVTPPAAAAVSSIVVDARSGRALAADHPDRRHHPASLAKMMTLYLAFQAVSRGEASLDQRLQVSRRAASRPPTKLGLRRGERISLKDLMLGLVTQSANDAAVVIAEGLAGKEKTFALRMTLKAKELGMTRTVFRNASGLPHRHAWTTPRDMSRLAQALQRDYQAYYRYFSTRTFSYRGRTYTNRNHLLGHYAGVDGLKTGYTRASGYHLVASAKRGEQRVIAVVMGGSTWARRDRRMVELLDTAFGRLLAASRKEPASPDVGKRVQRAAVSLSPVSAALAAAPESEHAAAALETAAQDWAVQVGAFRDRAGAEQTAERVMALDERLTVANKHIVAAGRGSGTLYLVRFNDFTESGASAVCSALRGAGTDCYAGPGL